MLSPCESPSAAIFQQKARMTLYPASAWDFAVHCHFLRLDLNGQWS